MSKQLWIMRGLPGSGKSTNAHNHKELLEYFGWTVKIFSTDYENEDAHKSKTTDSMRGIVDAQNHTLIIIDNINICAGDMRFYVQAGVENGFEVRVMSPTSEWAFDADECARLNVHNISLDEIRRMLIRWECDVTVEKILAG